MTDELTEELQEKVILQQEEIERLTAALSTTSHGDLEQKYLEAMRKLKGVTVKYESEKSKNDKMTHQLINMERRLIESERLNQSALPLKTNITSEGSESSSPTSKSAKELKDQVGQLQRTNAELKRQVSVQKNEIIKMKEILKKEVGEPANDLLSTIQSQSGESDGWRGRAQTISLLKSKLKETQRRLSLPSTVGNNHSTIAPSDSASRAADSTYHQTVDFDERHRYAISEVSSARKAKDNQLLEKNRNLEQHMVEKNSKITAATARISVLESDTSTLRIQLARVIEKTENDDRLLHAYKSELENKKIQLQDATASNAKGGFESTLVAVTDSDGYFDPNEKLRLEKEIEALRATVTSKCGPGDDYSELLRRQVDEYRLKYEHVETILNKERAAMTGTIASKVDNHNNTNNTNTNNGNGIPPEALEQMSLLKSEVTSLKDRILLMKTNHESELVTVSRISSEKLLSIEEENNDLRVQYQKMKIALAEALTAEQQQLEEEAEQQQHQQQQQEDVIEEHSAPIALQEDGPVPDSD